VSLAWWWATQTKVQSCAAAIKIEGEKQAVAVERGAAATPTRLRRGHSEGLEAEQPPHEGWFVLENTGVPHAGEMPQG
jgi:hypothetical protein